MNVFAFISNIVQMKKTLDDVKNDINSSIISKIRFSGKYKKLKRDIIDKINSYGPLNDEPWNAEILRNLQLSIIVNYYDMCMYFDSMSIPELEYASDEQKINIFTSNIFCTMYFKVKDKNHLIMLDIIASNISYTIFDENTGSSLEIVSESSTSRSRFIAENICKGCIRNTLINMIEDFKMEDYK